MYCFKLSNIFCFSKYGGLFYKVGLGLGWGGGIGGVYWCISILFNIYLWFFFVFGIYMYILYIYVCFICCKLFVNEFVLGLIFN